MASKDLYPDYESKWQALIKRDPKAARCFLYCVKSTGIFCRPTCAARLARQKNVVFFDTIEEAEEAGFRPCKRCKPMLPLHDTHHSVIRQTCKLLDESPRAVPHLKVLAEKAGFTQWHFHRIFRRFTGITPRMYWEARHLPNKQIKQKLSNIDLDELISKISQLDENTVIDHELIKSSYNKRPRSTSKSSNTAKKPAKVQKVLPQFHGLTPNADGDLFPDVPFGLSSAEEEPHISLLTNEPEIVTDTHPDALYPETSSDSLQFQNNSSPLPLQLHETFDWDMFFPDLNTSIAADYSGTPSPPSSETFSESLVLTPPLDDFDSLTGVTDSYSVAHQFGDDLMSLNPPV